MRALRAIAVATASIAILFPSALGRYAEASLARGWYQDHPARIPLQSTPESTDAEAIMEEVNALVDGWEQPLLAAAGWLHIVEHHDRNLDNPGVLPDGQPIPEDYIKDAWYLLDGRGMVTGAVVRMKTLQGGVVQEALFSKGKWSNLTAGEERRSGPFKLRLDFGFSENLSRVMRWSDAVSRRETTIDGSTALVFVIENKTTAGPLTWPEAPVTLETRAYFSADTGQFLLLEVVERHADGVEQPITRVRYLTIERGDPPDDVLRLFRSMSQ